MAIAVGSVHVDVVPSTRDFVKQMKKDLLGEADKIGQELGRKLGARIADDLGEQIGRGVAEGIEDGVDDADIDGAADEKGRKAGGAFARTFAAEITRAMDALPNIELESDPEGVLADIALIRDALDTLRDEDIGVSLSGTAALAQARALREELEALRDRTLDVNIRYDLDRSIADLTALERKIARDVGGSFENSLRDSLRGAVQSLPQIDVEVAGGARRELALLRNELETFADLADSADFGIDLDSGQALADVARISAALQAIASDTTIDVGIRDNAAAALGRLEAFTARVGRLDPEVEVEVETERAEGEVGAFTRRIRTLVEAAVRNLPDIEIDANTAPARRELQDIRENLAVFPDLEIGVDLSEDDALAGLARIEAALTALAANAPELDVRFNAAKTLADAVALREGVEEALGRAPAPEIEVEVVPRDIGKFGRDLRTAILKAQATLPDIEVNLATAPAYRDIAELRARLGTIAANIDIDTDFESVLAELQLVESAANAIDNDVIRIQFKSDVASVIADLVAVRTAAAAAGGAVNDLGDSVNNSTGIIRRWRLILAAVVLLLPLIAGAIVGLSAALALIITPIAAVALGLDGIKAAVQPLADEFNELRAVASRAFEAGLAPAVENLAALFPVLNIGIAGTSLAMSDLVTGVTALITTGRNLATIESSFNLLNAVIISMAPAVNLLTQNMVDLTNIGLQGLSTFGVELQQVGEAFRQVIARLNESGTAQAAVRALFQVLAELLNLLAPLTEFGAVALATFGPALAAALSVLGAAFGLLAGVLDSLPGPLQTVVTAALLMSTTFLILGRTLPGTAAAVALLSGLFPALALSTSAAAVALRGFLAILGGPIGVAIIAVVTALSFLGQAQSSAAQGAGEHQAAVQELAGALRDSGGAITDNIRELTAKKLIDSGAAESAAELGISTAELTSTVSAQGPAYDALIARLQATADEYAVGSNAAFLSTEAQRANSNSARELLGVLLPLGQQFIDAAAYNRELNAALQETNQPLVGGAANAAQLGSAIETLGLASSTTSDKVKALSGALDALNGGVLTADEAAAALRESIDGIGESFAEAAAETKAAGVELIMANGAIDNTTVKGRELSEQLSNIRDGMIESATSAFDAAGGLQDIEAASAAAAAEVDVARAAIIEAATAAGLSADEAARLADRYNAIPSEVVTLLSAQGLPTVNVELEQLLSRMNAVPGAKEIRVTALSDEARAVLDALGVEVENLEDGSFRLLVDDQTRPGIEAALGYARSQSGQIPIGADADPLRTEIDAQIAALAVTQAELQLTAGTEGFQSIIAGEIARLQGQRADLPVGADPAPLLAQLPGLAAQINATTGVINIDGQPQPALTALANTLGQIAAGEESVTIDGFDLPAQTVLGSVLEQIQASEASVTIGGENFPAAQVLDATLAAIRAGQENVTIGGEDVPAQSVLAALLGRVGASQAAIRVLADAAAANATIDYAARTRTAIIRVVTTGANAANVSNPNLTGNSGQAHGNYLVPMARGGMLTPMAARAAKIAPNTWRVIGDNMRVPEIYAPLDGSARSLSFLRAGIKSYGLDIARKSAAPMAAGGILTAAQQFRNLSTQQAGTFAPVLTIPGRDPGTPNRDNGTEQLAKKFDQVVEVFRQSSRIPPITVEDRSGNPIETARSVALAIRLPRR